MTVDVVIVTYNRLEKLKKALASYENQTMSFRNLIVVNNHSTDGTDEYLEAWKNSQTVFSKYIINTDENLGGSGGYFLGQKKAMELGADWVFLADDDAYAKPNMMECFCNYVESHNTRMLSAICGTVYHSDGTIDLNHRSRFIRKGCRFVYRIPSKTEDYEKNDFEVDFLSYVGSFINGQALLKVGPVDARFFIFWDDSEHSLRLKRFGSIICVPEIGIVHDDGKNGKDIINSNNNSTATWKDYYLIRNEVFMYRKHFPLAAIHQLRKELKYHFIIKNSKTTFERIRWAAFKDAWLGRMGKHKVYKPGWEA